MTALASAVQLSATLCAIAATPIPLNWSAANRGPAPESKLSLPEAEPDDCGLKRIVIRMLCPEARVSGRDKPETENSELFNCFEAIVTEPFEAKTVTRLETEVPTTVFEKETELGVKVSLPVMAVCGAAVDVTSYAALPLSVGDAGAANEIGEKQKSIATRAWGKLRMIEILRAWIVLYNSHKCTRKMRSAAVARRVAFRSH